jgi:hypothetical protein
MIRTGELRLGNLVSYSDEPERISFKIVIAIHTEQVDTGYRKPLGVEKIYPIPLTHEILLKMGFEREAYKDLPQIIRPGDHEKGDLFTQTYYRYNYKGFRVSEQFEAGGRKRSLHQLQNLFFALYDEELNIDELILFK